MPPEPKRMYDGPALGNDKLAVISEGARLWLAVKAIDGSYVVNPVVGGAPPPKACW